MFPILQMIRATCGGRRLSIETRSAAVWTQETTHLDHATRVEVHELDVVEIRHGSLQAVGLWNVGKKGRNLTRSIFSLYSLSFMHGFLLK